MSDTILYDVDGQEIITTALMDLLNQYPGLKGEEITYSTLNKDSGIAAFPTSGAAVREERTNILGKVTQTCDYPFVVVFRASGLNQKRKETAKEWLDNLGRWLEKQPVFIDGIGYKLNEYPALSRGRKFKSIARTSVSYLDSENDAKAENWVINITATYINEFWRE